MDNIVKRIKELDAPVSVRMNIGTDTIPPDILKTEFEKRWMTSNAMKEAITSYCKIVIDAVKDIVPAITIPTEKFLLYGSDGMEALFHVSKYAQESGLLVIEDANISVPYSVDEIKQLLDFRLGMPPIDELKQRIYFNDFLTFNPYLNSDIIRELSIFSKLHKKYGFITLRMTDIADYPDQLIAYSVKDLTECPLYMKLCHEIDIFSDSGENGFKDVGISIKFKKYSNELKTLKLMFPNIFMHLRNYDANNLDSTACVLKDFHGILDIDEPFVAPSNPSYVGLSMERAIQTSCNEIISKIRSF